MSESCTRDMLNVRVYHYFAIIKNFSILCKAEFLVRIHAIAYLPESAAGYRLYLGESAGFSKAKRQPLIEKSYIL
jgi:hypothetical protein